MSFQICIKTDKSLQEIAREMQELLSLPPFTQNAFAGEPYCQFEMMGMHILIQFTDEEDRDPEVKQYPFRFDMHLSLMDLDLDADAIEYGLQPYYAQLLAGRLGFETACLEKQRAGRHWQIRYRFYCKNPQWDESRLFGEEGWKPPILVTTPSRWRVVVPGL